jgi:CPA2 family monovalent cation:H+ antiporter-2
VDLWFFMMELVMLLAGAFLLGALAQRMRQSPIVGYLLSGAIIGPLLFNTEAVNQSAELGVSLLLFSIGLEFSLKRLRQMGRMAFGGGALQVVLTLALVILALFHWTGWPMALTIGAMVALSSTAVVMRVLVDRAEIDSVRGRTCLAILLFQDIAIVPLVLMVSLLGAGNTESNIALQIAKICAAALGLGIVCYLLLYHLVPRLLATQGLFANRELTILLAIAVGLGAAWSAHALGISPALGAFLAGILLGESPFAVQIRSDISTLRTIMVTLFFASVGMLAKPMWFITQIHWVLLAAGLIFATKTIIIFLVGLFFRLDHRNALASGLSMAQIGEFSFVLATAGRLGGVLDDFAFDLMISSIIVLMFAAPYMVSHAFALGDRLMRIFSRKQDLRPAAEAPPNPYGCAVLVVGFGPAGRNVVAHLIERQMRAVVVDINPQSRSEALQAGVQFHLGDAANEEILAHAGLMHALMAVVTLPGPTDGIRVIEMIKKMRPDMMVAARCRYHRHVPDLKRAGAQIILDEETLVGHALGDKIADYLFEADGTAMACRLAGQSLASPSFQADP